VYILHFQQPLHHAKHYVGSTTDIVGRVKKHATGDGARLTAVVKENGGHFRVAALFQPTRSESIRLLEIVLKRKKNACKYCPICNPDAIAPAGMIAIPIPIELKGNH